MISEHWRTRYHRYGHSLYTNKHTPIRNVENLDNEQRGYYVRPALYKINWESGNTMLDDTPPGPIILLVYEVADYNEVVSLYNQLKFRKLVSVFGSNEEFATRNFKALSCGGLFINQAPEDSSLPSAGMGFNSNITNGGSDILTHLVRKKFIFGMDAIKDQDAPEEAAVVESDPAKMVTLIEEDSSDEDYADW